MTKAPPAALPTTEAEARGKGWKRCFVAEEPRLTEMVETYAELGFEVVTVPVDLAEGDCTECLRQAPERFRVIYTREPQAADPPGSGEPQ